MMYSAHLALVLAAVVTVACSGGGSRLPPRFDEILPRCADIASLDSSAWIGEARPLARLKHDQDRYLRPPEGTYYIENGMIAVMERGCEDSVQGFRTSAYEFPSMDQALAYLRKQEAYCDKSLECSTFVPKSVANAKFNYIAGHYGLSLDGKPALFTLWASWDDGNDKYSEEFAVDVVIGEYVVKVATFYREKNPGFVAAVGELTTHRQWSADGLLVALLNTVLQRWR